MFHRKLGVVDYVVFSCVLAVFTLIGLLPACIGGRQRTPAEYLQGNHRMSLLPVALSLTVSFVSGIILLGVPAETYFYGIHFLFFGFSHVLGALMAAYSFLPIFYHSQVSSVNQYLMLRFSSRCVLVVSTVLQGLYMLVIMSVVIAGPAVFMATVSDVPVWASIVLMGSVSTLYSSLGGLKAVIWTDVSQAVVLYVGMLAVLIQATLKTGSVQRIWQLYVDGGRTNIDLIPSLVKNNLWSVAVMPALMWYLNFGVMQIAVQRYNSLPDFATARRSMLLQIPSVLVILPTAGAMGIAAYGYYTHIGCDPYAAGYINNFNQIIPYLVMDILTTPGLPGLFFSALFAAALSNVSSALTALTSFLWEDALSQHFVESADVKKTLVLKSLMIFCGSLSTLATFLVLRIGGTFIRIIISVVSALMVPIGVLFILGAGLPLANGKCALLSSLLAFILVMWLTQGSIRYPSSVPPLPTSTYHCPFGNGTSQNTSQPEVTTVGSWQSTDITTTTYLTDNESWWAAAYNISHLCFVPIGLVFGTIVGIILTAIPACRSKERINAQLIFPFLRTCFRNYIYKEPPVHLPEKGEEIKLVPICI